MRTMSGTGKLRVVEGSESVNAEKIKEYSEELIACESIYASLMKTIQPWGVSIDGHYPSPKVRSKLVNPIYDALNERIEELKQSLKKAIK